MLVFSPMYDLNTWWFYWMRCRKKLLPMKVPFLQLKVLPYYWKHLQPFTEVWHLSSLALERHFDFSSVQFSHSVMSDSLRPYESQHTRPPCPSPTPGVYSNSCPSSRWCHPAISSSVIPFSSCPQSLPASGSFPTSQLFAWGGQSIGVSTSVLPVNTQDWSPLEQTGWISLQSKDSQESSSTPQFKSINSLALSFLHSPTLTSIHDHWKNHSLN